MPQCPNCNAFMPPEATDCKRCGSLMSGAAKPMSAKPDTMASPSQNAANSLNMADYQPAGFWIRFSANFVDGLIFLPLSILIAANLMLWKNLILAIVLFIPGFIYKPFMESFKGATLGKKALGVRVIDSNGKNIDLGKAFLRALPFLALALSSLAGQLLLLANPQAMNFGQMAVNGHPPAASPTQAIDALLGLFLIISCLTIVFNKKKQAIHDMIAGTYCVKRKGKSAAGCIIAVLLFFGLIAIIGLLAAIAVPNFMKAKITAQESRCRSNLKQIDGATQVWIIDNRLSDTATPKWSDLVPNYLKRVPVCPLGGQYTLGNKNNMPVCSHTKMLGRDGSINQNTINAVGGSAPKAYIPDTDSSKETITSNHKNMCYANLKQIEMAAKVWAMDNGFTGNETPGWEDLIPKYLKKKPVCPDGGTYKIGNEDVPPACDYPGHGLDGGNAVPADKNAYVAKAAKASPVSERMSPVKQDQYKGTRIQKGKSYELVLKSGEEVEGTAVDVTDSYVKIDFHGVDLTYFFRNIVSIKEKSIPGEGIQTTSGASVQIKGDWNEWYKKYNKVMNDIASITNKDNQMVSDLRDLADAINQHNLENALVVAKRLIPRGESLQEELKAYKVPDEFSKLKALIIEGNQYELMKIRSFIDGDPEAHNRYDRLGLESTLAMVKESKRLFTLHGAPSSFMNSADAQSESLKKKIAELKNIETKMAMPY